MKRTYIVILKYILEALNDGKEHSYGDLERRVNTNWKTIRNNIEILELFGAVIVKDTKVKINSLGMRILSDIKNR